MFFYSITGGDIDRAEIVDEILIHDKKLSANEFVKIYNNTLKQVKVKFSNNDYGKNLTLIVEYLCKNCGFARLEPTFTVDSAYLNYGEITTDKMSNDSKVFFSE